MALFSRSWGLSLNPFTPPAGSQLKRVGFILTKAALGSQSAKGVGGVSRCLGFRTRHDQDFSVLNQNPTTYHSLLKRNSKSWSIRPFCQRALQTAGVRTRQSVFLSATPTPERDFDRGSQGRVWRSGPFFGGIESRKACLPPSQFSPARWGQVQSHAFLFPAGIQSPSPRTEFPSGRCSLSEAEITSRATQTEPQTFDRRTAMSGVATGRWHDNKHLINNLLPAVIALFVVALLLVFGSDSSRTRLHRTPPSYQRRGNSPGIFGYAVPAYFRRIDIIFCYRCIVPAPPLLQGVRPPPPATTAAATASHSH